MIVKCEQCQTRFRIPDEKVTEKGVKVRCTKCHNTFRVKRAAGEAASEAVAEVPSAPAPSLKPPESSPLPEPAPQVRFDASPEPPPSFDPAPASSPGFDFSAPPDLPPDPGAAQAGFEPPMPEPSAAGFQPPELSFEAPPAPASPSSSFHPPEVSFDAPAPQAPALPTDPGDGGFDFGAPPAPAAAASDLLPTGAGGDFTDPFFSERAGAPPEPEPAAVPPLVVGSETDLLEPSGGQRASSSQPAAEPDPFGDLTPAPAAASAQEADPFGDLAAASSSIPAPAAELGAPAPMGGVEASVEARNDLFDLKAAPPAQRPTPVEASPAPATPSRAPEQHAPPAATVAAPKQGGKRHRSGLGQRLLANAFGALLLVAALVLVALGSNEGRLELSSGLQPMFAGPRDLAVVDVSNGLYDTVAGRPVFYVRGAVENRTQKAAKVKLRAEIVEGDALVRSGETFAGAALSPEQLHRLASSEEVDRLAAESGAAAVEVRPGERAPFIVVFYEYPPDLSGFGIRVIASEAGSNPTAQRE